ncbi:hypothetical protein CHLRE_01g054000v5 [Chlamydomonas reinhardtii]|uniref:G-patch domain-containing protein n=1 Tax=Chlamydomonas reinhardtii TaxID=3055 RepID=A0A2K3E885_CHLRE|nr:uncharacterized protein CHLRE_01g054000v5 [Chlamydomonas reinhardtii]PNW88998.1 hypothetical protein CHLRE_01g054000v5 [Chlamydomonas reinhardtii]
MKLPPGYVAGVGVHKATAFGGLGQRLMEQMGWQKGQGLGKDKSGMKEAIEVKEKKDVLGVGADASWNWDRKYWDDAYNSAIQNINHETSSNSSSSGSSDGSASSSDDSSDSDSDSSGRRRGGKRARQGKGGAVVVHRDGTLASASADELKIAAELAKDPWGRWGGRAGKMARIRAQEQEEANRARAKLGLPPLPAAPVRAAAPDSSDSSSSDSDSDSDGPSTSGRGSDSDASAGRRKKGEKKGAKGSEGKKDKKKDKKKAGKEGAGAAAGAGAEAGKAPAAKKRIVVVLGSDAAAEARAKMFATFKPTPAEGWWGAKMFVSVGLMESLEDEAEREARMQATAAKQDADAAAGVVALRGAAAVAAGQRKGFCEDDQEALYKRAHDFQRVGRRGLGKAEIKVGAKWEGTKKTFGEENDQEGGDPAEGGKQQLGDDEEEAQEQPHNEGAAAGKKKGKKDKKQDKEGKGSGRKAKAEADAEDGGEVKKSKRQKTAAAAAEADETPGSTVAATSAEAAEGANGGAAPPPKWLKLAKTVLKKSAERRMKLRKVVEELVAAAEEHHRKHHHHRHHHHSKKDKKDKKSKKAGAEAGAEDAAAGATAGSPWCENSVREVLERKIRKSNSGLALDGKYVTLVAAGGEA